MAKYIGLCIEFLVSPLTIFPKHHQQQTSELFVNKAITFEWIEKLSSNSLHSGTGAAIALVYEHFN